MNETIKLWLINLYEKEIETVKGAMSNNHLCILSSSTEDDEHMFIQNEMDMKEYLEVLETLKMEIEQTLHVNIVVRKDVTLWDKD